MKLVANGFLLLALGCSTSATTEVNTPASEPCASSDDPCSFERVSEGNRAVKRLDYEGALELFIGCPERNLPNLAGLLEQYPPTRRRLEVVAAELQKEVVAPKVSNDLNLLVRILDLLGEGARLLSLYRGYVAAGFAAQEQGFVFGPYLANGGYYAEALVGEPSYRKALLSALDKLRENPMSDALSNEGLLFLGTTQDFLVPLVGAGRTLDAKCLVQVLSASGGTLAKNELPRLVAEACTKASDPVACVALLQSAIGQKPSEGCLEWWEPGS